MRHPEVIEVVNAERGTDRPRPTPQDLIKVDMMIARTDWLGGSPTTVAGMARGISGYNSVESG